MHDGSESQSQHKYNSIYVIISQLVETWIPVVSLSETSLHTQTTVGETTLWQRNDRSRGLIFERATTNEDRLMTV